MRAVPTILKEVHTCTLYVYIAAAFSLLLQPAPKKSLCSWGPGGVRTRLGTYVIRRLLLHGGFIIHVAQRRCKTAGPRLRGCRLVKSRDGERKKEGFGKYLWTLDKLKPSNLACNEIVQIPIRGRYVHTYVHSPIKSSTDSHESQVPTELLPMSGILYNTECHL